MKINKNDTVSLAIGSFGLVLSIYGLWEKHPVIIGLGVIISIIATITFIKYIELNSLFKKTNIIIDGKRIDSLNLANLTRDPNKSLKIQAATHFARINGHNLELTFIYSGYCKSNNGESGFEFSIDSDANLTFEEMECYGFDLKTDPEKKHKLYPSLIESDGLTKKIMLPFSKCIVKGQQFQIYLYCNLPNCMAYGKDYVTTTLSFDDNMNIEEFTINIEFISSFPKWMRVYSASDGKPKLIKDIKPYSKTNKLIKYIDHYNNIDAKTALIYFFYRQQNNYTH